MLDHPDTAYVDNGVDFLDPQLYSAPRATFGLASMLPRAAYTSEVFQRLEDEKVWTREWVCIGTTPEIADPLDLLPYTIGNHAIHVQRMPDGSLVGRFNKAQHGGCRSIPVQCQTGRKTKCSYTSCGYSRDRGVIRGTSLTEMSPQMGQYLGATPERLIPVDIATVGPLLFANIDPARDTREALVPPSWSDGLVRRDGLWQEHRSNWKLAGAAIMDAARIDLDRGAADPVTADWTSPNLILVRSRRATLAVILQPTAMEQTLWRLSFFSAPDLADEDYSAARADLMRLLEEAAARATALQTKVETTGGRDLAELSLAAWMFNQSFIDRMTRRHVAYWNAPLMRA